jgi:hypothetical protein
MWCLKSELQKAKIEREQAEEFDNISRASASNTPYQNFSPLPSPAPSPVKSPVASSQRSSPLPTRMRTRSQDTSRRKTMFVNGLYGRSVVRFEPGDFTNNDYLCHCRNCWIDREIDRQASLAQSSGSQDGSSTPTKGGISLKGVELTPIKIKGILKARAERPPQDFCLDRSISEEDNRLRALRRSWSNLDTIVVDDDKDTSVSNGRKRRFVVEDTESD